MTDRPFAAWVKNHVRNHAPTPTWADRRYVVVGEEEDGEELLEVLFAHDQEDRARASLRWDFYGTADVWDRHERRWLLGRQWTGSVFMELWQPGDPLPHVPMFGIPKDATAEQVRARLIRKITERIANPPRKFDLAGLLAEHGTLGAALDAAARNRG